MSNHKSSRTHFNECSQKLLKDAINRLPGLAESLKENDIDLAKEDAIHIFGYGSLPDQPHHPPTSKTTAYLWDYQRDMCCRSVASGTYRAPGLTLGIDKKDGSIVPGSILSYEGLSLYEKIDMLNKFADREVVKKLPIYTFKMLKIEKEDGTIILALTCVADHQNRKSYVGDMLTPLEKEHLSTEEQEDYSLHKKAAKIAAANGEKKTSLTDDDHDETQNRKFSTGKSYFDRFIRLHIQENLIKDNPEHNDKLSPAKKKRQTALYQEQQRMLTLGQYIDEYREHMATKAPKLIAHFEKVEQDLLEDWQENRIQLAEHLKHEARQKRKAAQPKKAKMPPRTPPAASKRRRRR